MGIQMSPEASSAAFSLEIGLELSVLGGDLSTEILLEFSESFLQFRIG